MSHDSTSSTDANDGGDTGDDLHGGSEGHASDIPEESPASESELALDRQAARINSDSEQDSK